MRNTHATVLNTLIRVQRFLDTNAGALGTIDQSGYRTVLDDVVRTLGAHAVQQTTSKQVGAAQTAKQRVLRNALRLNHMRPIFTVASAQLRQTPEFAALRMPPAQSSSRALIAWAGAMASAASGYAKAFTDAGLPADFLAQLQRASDALGESLSNKGAIRSTQSGATAGLSSESTRGRQAVKVLDSLVEPVLAGDIALLAQWKSAKRFGGKSLPVSSASVDAAAKGAVASPIAQAAGA